MKITKEDYEYLSGARFSNGYYMQLGNNPLYTRLQQILRMTKGKSVLHVGCCDHLPLIQEKIRQHSWLQGLLEENCREVVGVDINQEAVDYINNNRLCREKVYCADITSEDFKSIIPQGRKFDVVLLGEIVEHLDNPVLFLQKMKNNMEDYGFAGQYIVTVPNAFSFLKIRTVRGGIEGINSDHRFWFTPYTICKVMVQSGLYPEEILFVSYGRGGNVAGRYMSRAFALLEKIRGVPSAYKSFRGDQMIVSAYGEKP